MAKQPNRIKDLREEKSMTQVRLSNQSTKDISYQGALSIAFGARGSGRAVAHYEPLRQVINLTKMNGAGSLAHEWWHGLDDYLGGKIGAGGMLSEKPHKHPLMAKLIDTIKYKPETPEQAAARAGVQDARTVRNAESWLKSEVLPSLTRSSDEKALAEYEKLKTAFLSGETGSVDKLSELKKSVTGRIIPKETRDKLHIFESILHGMAERPELTIGKTQTEFYKNSKKMGEISEKDGGYWDSNIEMTARAFATYIMDKGGKGKSRQHGTKYQREFAGDTAKSNGTATAPETPKPPADSAPSPDKPPEPPRRAGQSSRLQFTSDERPPGHDSGPLPDKKLSKLQGRADKLDNRLERARDKRLCAAGFPPRTLSAR